MESGESSVLASLDVAHGQFGSLLARVSADDWERPTPCDEWDVRALADHVASAARIYTALLEGLPFARAMSTGSAVVPATVDRAANFASASASCGALSLHAVRWERFVKCLVVR
ncbi:MAG: maleylpyruvate isomerase N-terminal domain-containing protein [Acidimicrobiales bacterium]